MYIKCTVVGDGAVGKTCMLANYATGGFPDTYEATIHDRYCVQITVDNQPLDFDIWDTAGQEDFDQLRPASYPGTDVFLLCYGICNIASFNNARQKWFPELKRHCPNVPIIIVGTKGDMRADINILQQMQARGQRPVSQAMGLQLCKFLGAFTFRECSAKDGRGVKNVFDAAIQAAYQTGRVHSNAGPGGMPAQRRKSTATKVAGMVKRLSNGFGSAPTVGGKIVKPVKIEGYQVGQPLPGGWKTAVDSKSGEVYYYNKQLGATSWTPPAGLEI